MKAIFLIISILFSIVFSTSCERESSEDVNQDRIYTDYELFYNANEDKTYARATFRFGSATGTLLELASPSEVLFNNELLSFKPALAYYEKDFAGFIESGTFTWRDVDEVEFSNEINIVDIDFPTDLDTISRDEAFELFWIGDSLSANQSVILTANGVLEGDAQIINQTNINSNSIIIPLNKLQVLGQGNGTLWLDRIYNPSIIQKTSAGGNITGRYRPINKTVYFK
jgi:hypothetical protein